MFDLTVHIVTTHLQSAKVENYLFGRDANAQKSEVTNEFEHRLSPHFFF